jgi:hypothetical protein
MATINSTNNSLSGQTGTGSAVGNESNDLTGTLNFGDSVSFEIPNTFPVPFDIPGEIDLPNVTNFGKLIRINDGTSGGLYCIAVPSTGLSTLDGDIVSRGASGFEMSQPAGAVSGKDINIKFGNLSSNIATTSTTYVSTGLTASITPTSATSTILIEVYGSFTAPKTGGGNNTQIRHGSFNLRRTTQTASDLSSMFAGRDLGTNSNETTECWGSLCMGFTESAGSTATKTYILQYRSELSSTIFKLLGATNRAIMILTELI